MVLIQINMVLIQINMVLIQINMVIIQINMMLIQINMVIIWKLAQRTLSAQRKSLGVAKASEASTASAASS